MKSKFRLREIVTLMFLFITLLTRPNRVDRLELLEDVYGNCISTVAGWPAVRQNGSKKMQLKVKYIEVNLHVSSLAPHFTGCYHLFVDQNHNLCHRYK